MERRKAPMLFAEQECGMYSVDDLVVYGGEGVCRVEKIAPLDMRGVEKSKLYYTLSPLYGTGHVMTPVDTAVLMRPVMSRQDAEELVQQLPQLPEERPERPGMRALREHYQAIVASYDCRRMASLIKTVKHKRRWALAHGRKLSQMDERYFHRAWEQLFGELAAALQLPREQAEQYAEAISPGWYK